MAKIPKAVHPYTQIQTPKSVKEVRTIATKKNLIAKKSWPILRKIC